MKLLISPIKGCLELRIKQLLTTYQGVHITYFNIKKLILRTMVGGGDQILSQVLHTALDKDKFRNAAPNLNIIHIFIPSHA